MSTLFVHNPLYVCPVCHRVLRQNNPHARWTTNEKDEDKLTDQ